MSRNDTWRRQRSLSFFFLRAFLFNPLNNPAFIILAILIAFFYVEGSLDKYHIALMMYLVIIGHCFVGNMFGRSAETDSSALRLPLHRHFQALPVSGRMVYTSYLLSAVVYAVFIYAALSLILMHFMELPDLKHVQYTTSVTPEGDTVTTVTGIAMTPRMIQFLVSFVLEKSLLFDLVPRQNWILVGTVFYFVLAFIYISILQVSREFVDGSRFSLRGLLWRAPLGSYMLFSLLFLTEIMFTQREMGLYHQIVRRHLDLVLGFLVATIGLTIVSVTWMSGMIAARLKAEST